MNLASHPNVERKLVGGKLMLVINDLPSHRLTASSFGRHRSPDTFRAPPLADKPNRVDPRDWQRSLDARFALPAAGQRVAPRSPVRANGGRSEKSDLQLDNRSDFEGRYRILPQIGSPSNGHNHHDDQHGTHYTTIDDLYSRLPSVTEMPQNAIFLSLDEERLLANEVGREMHNIDPGCLKEVYTHLASLDSNLDGVTDLFNIQLALSRYKIFLPPNLLRLVAARFISSRFAGKVNYERIISFLGAAMKSARSPRQVTDRSTYRHQSPMGSPRSHDGKFHYEEHHPHENRSSCPVESIESRGLASLLHQLKHNRALNNFPLEWLRATFQRTDSMHRGTLSEHQIKDIAYHCGLPIEDQMLTKLIRCCRHRGGGQYDWQDFIGFLERVGQLPTGLEIPRSRRPLEMARHTYEPSSDWPHVSNAFAAPRGNGYPTGRMSQTSSNGEHGGQPMYREPSPPPPHSQRLQIDPNRRSDYYNQLDYSSPEDNQRYQQAPPPPLPPQQLQEQQHQQQNGRETEVEALPVLPPNSLSRENILKESWLNRFVRLADTLYDADSAKSGFLDRTKLLRLIHDYNSAYLLDFSPADIEREVNSCTKATNDRTDYHVVLRKLAALRA